MGIIVGGDAIYGGPDEKKMTYLKTFRWAVVLLLIALFDAPAPAEGSGSEGDWDFVFSSPVTAGYGRKALFNADDWREIGNEKELKQYEKLAESGDLDAQHRVGVTYLKRVGQTEYDAVGPASGEAQLGEYWLLRAAERGSAKSARALAHAYSVGLGVHRSANRLRQIMRIGASYGSADLMVGLAALADGKLDPYTARFWMFLDLAVRLGREDVRDLLEFHESAWRQSDIEAAKVQQREWLDTQAKFPEPPPRKPKVD